MSEEREVHCLRCGWVEDECSCAEGHASNPYTYLEEIESKLGEVQAMNDILTKRLKKCGEDYLALEAMSNE